MAWTKSPQPLIDLFDKSVPSGASVSRRKMFGYPAAFANGNLFIGLHQNDFIVRLSEADRARFSAQYGERIFEPMKGRPMREYVRLPEELLADARKRASWIKRSLEYAEGVKPKAEIKPKLKTQLKTTPKTRARK
jgi:TfoX/Sxy family transcriptional regulator of competence genes